MDDMAMCHVKGSLIVMSHRQYYSAFSEPTDNYKPVTGEEHQYWTILQNPGLRSIPVIIKFSLISFSF